jgi:hypothetical protein
MFIIKLKMLNNNIRWFDISVNDSDRKRFSDCAGSLFKFFNISDILNSGDFKFLCLL